MLEVLTSLVIIAILVGLLIPCLIYARDSARQTICAGNLKQISNGFLMYTSEWDRFPGYPEMPEWRFGGVVFRSTDHLPILASDRPINRYLADEDQAGDAVAALFRCPSDAGIFPYPRGRRPQRPESVLENGTCFETFGSSYRANGLLLDARLAGIDPSESRPVKMAEVSVAANRLIVVGDPEWYFATRKPGDPDAVLDASWHNVPGAGNAMAMDGSIRFIELSPETVGRNGKYTLHPRR